eukprot:c20603_g1_i2.p1 GENE.c20603_g1_i2~~c20603_g1_i2.p1  ORF type:complete len:400 (+),score=79.91 c20603_g1_i2:48-1247(+)
MSNQQEQDKNICNLCRVGKSCNNKENNNLFHPTSECRHFFRGSCKNGDRCRYIHDPSKKNTVARTRAGKIICERCHKNVKGCNPSKNPQDDRVHPTKTCRNWASLEGKCQNISSCPFVHDPKDQARETKTVCSDCQKGKNCHRDQNTNVYHPIQICSTWKESKSCSSDPCYYVHADRPNHHSGKKSTPIDMVFVIDNSGSMRKSVFADEKYPSRIQACKDALVNVAYNVLREDDTFEIFSFNSYLQQVHNQMSLKVLKEQEKGYLETYLQTKISAGGQTALWASIVGVLERVRESAKEVQRKKLSRRCKIMFLTDGDDTCSESKHKISYADASATLKKPGFTCEIFLVSIGTDVDEDTQKKLLKMSKLHPTGIQYLHVDDADVGIRTGIHWAFDEEDDS